ncbi:MAG: hypothetical protein JNN11_01255 [Candidatus Doudnabacteria bacterium]|nr:hypothetical protein [Candidatus Doudnabacteria bacterium]
MQILKEWWLVLLLMLVACAYFVGHTQSAWAVVAVQQGLPLALALSMLARVLSNNHDAWASWATKVMLFWLVSLVPQLWLEVDKAIVTALYQQSDALGSAASNAKEKALLNAAAQAEPANLPARKKLFVTNELLAEQFGDKVGAETLKLYQQYAAGRLTEKQLRTELAKLRPRLETADGVHADLMTMVKGPEVPPAPKGPLPAPLGMPHIVWLLLTVVVSLVALSWADNWFAKVLIVASMAAVGFYSIRGMISQNWNFSLSLPDWYISWDDPLNIGYAVIAILVILMLGRLGKKTSHGHGGGH